MRGGSSLGYKRAGFQVVGNVEIDPRINDLYVINNHPKYNFCEDLRVFNEREDIPEDLIDIDILDGSPPCTSFSTAGVREEGWGKSKKFREGQKVQTLDDLFFVFLDTVEKLNPKIVVAENVTGIIKGKAKGYVNLIIKRFEQLGYAVQIFQLNAAHMDVPQARHRVFFIANRCGYKKLKLQFNGTPIIFKEVRSEKGIPFTKTGEMKTLLENATKGDRKLEHTLKRMTGSGGKYYGQMLIHDEQVAPTITAGGQFYRFCDKTKCSQEDFRNMQSFPQDYYFGQCDAQYACGMSVPPNMMANIATEIYEQWLK